MERYEENYLRSVEVKVNEIRCKALQKARLSNPNAAFAVDKHSFSDYCRQQWDYPGMWYTYFTYPKGFKNDEELINRIAADTLAYFNRHAYAETIKKGVQPT